jgi:hypothetical protein
MRRESNRQCSAAKASDTLQILQPPFDDEPDSEFPATTTPSNDVADPSIKGTARGSNASDPDPSGPTG